MDLSNDNSSVFCLNITFDQIDSDTDCDIAIGVAVGGILLIIIVILLLIFICIICCCMKRRKKTKKDNTNESETGGITEPNNTSSIRPSTSNNDANDKLYEEPTYQDPSTIQREKAHTGDIYTLPQRKSERSTSVIKPNNETVKIEIIELTDTNDMSTIKNDKELPAAITESTINDPNTDESPYSLPTEIGKDQVSKSDDFITDTVIYDEILPTD